MSAPWWNIVVGSRVGDREDSERFAMPNTWRVLPCRFCDADTLIEPSDAGGTSNDDADLHVCCLQCAEHALDPPRTADSKEGESDD